MTFKIQIDNVPYRRKPESRDVSRMKQQIGLSAPVSMTPADFKAEILQGKSFSPAVLQGSKAEDWREQQLFCVDIDNEDKTAPKGQKRRAEQPLTVEEVLRRCSDWGLQPFLIYETFSSSPEWPKFRIAFAASQPITDGTERDRVQLALMELFPECDTACKNRDRLFYGGKAVLYFDEEAVLDLQAVGSLVQALSRSAEKSPAPLTEGIRGKSQAQSLQELKDSFDFLGYIRSFGGKEKRAGRYIFFNPCPICGHKDDFVFYPDTNTFYCYGQTGDVGGSIIDFLMHKDQLDKKQAIEKFKYDLCGLPRTQDKKEMREKRMLRKAEKAGREVQDGLPPYIYADEKTDGKVKYLISAPLLTEFIRKNSHYLFVRDTATDAVRRYWYVNGVYKLISNEELKGYIKKHIADYDLSIQKMKDVNEVFQDLITDCSFVSEEELNRAEKLINFQNGLLNLETMELQPHDPDVLSTIQLPCRWNPQSMTTQGGAPVFTRFLQTLTDGDQGKQQLLLEYMGACLSNVSGYRFKKALFLVGPGNTGKSQLKALTERLLGSSNSAAIDLKDLEKRFGTSMLYGKRLAGSSDMGYVSINELRIFKQITGGDSIFLEFKNDSAFNYTYRGLLWFCTNELPKFGGDRGEWVYDRIMTLRCSHVIPPEEQDKFLLDKMYAEREAVVYWALLSFRQAYQRGCRFTIPEESRELLEEYKKLNSPVIQFYEECCTDRPTGKPDKCTAKKLHDVFKAWCRDNSGGGYCCTPQKFREELAGYLRVAKEDLTKKIKGDRFYTFTLTAQTKQDYSTVYGYDSLD